MKACPDCGSRVFRLGCVNCDEVNYIAEQEMLTEFQYGTDARANPNADFACCSRPSAAQSDGHAPKRSSRIGA